MAPRPAPSSSTPAHGHDYTPLRVLNRTEEGSGRRTSSGEDDDDDNEEGENKDEERRAGSDGGTTMQRAASEDEEPLLEGQPVTRPTREERVVQRSPWLDAADGTESRSGADTLIMGNMRGYSAWGVQMFALAFMALIWPMVLQRMPWHKLPLFGYHPLAQSLSLILLAQGLLVLQPTTPQTPKRKGQALIWHQLFFLISFLPLVTAGAWIMWHLHSKPRAKHFISWHGTLGAVAVVWAWMQAAVGAASVWFKGRALGGEARAKSMWKWHRLSGYMLLSLFVLIHILAVTETEWVRGSVPLFHRAAAVLAVIGFAAVIATRVQTSKMPQLIRRG